MYIKKESVLDHCNNEDDEEEENYDEGSTRQMLP